jgi:magnesium transporter
MDLLENYRDVAASLVEVYLTSVSNRMNEVMKLLTVFTAVFIPMSLVAGIYGMNFNTERSPWNMPELNWIFGYPFALGVMGFLGAVILLFFRHKGWIGKRDEEKRRD